MTQRQFSREFELEAVRLVEERGVSVVQASRDLDVGESILRRWIKELTSDPGQAFPGQGQLKPDQQEIDRLRREVTKPAAAQTESSRSGRVQPSGLQGYWTMDHGCLYLESRVRTHCAQLGHPLERADARKPFDVPFRLYNRTTDQAWTLKIGAALGGRFGITKFHWLLAWMMVGVGFPLIL